MSRNPCAILETDRNLEDYSFRWSLGTSKRYPDQFLPQLLGLRTASACAIDAVELTESRRNLSVTVMTKLCQSTWNAITHRNRDQTEEVWCSQRYATKGSRKQWKSVGVFNLPDQYQPPGTMTPTKRQIKHRDWKHELKAQTMFLFEKIVLPSSQNIPKRQAQRRCCRGGIIWRRRCSGERGANGVHSLLHPGPHHPRWTW